jgi:predicted phage terminase large subunit-like protein
MLLENKASGTQLIQELSQEGTGAITAYQLEAGLNKQMRLHAQTRVIENGLVFVPAMAEWLDCYLHELTMFPAGKHDDQVNSTVQALRWIKNRPGFRWLPVFSSSALPT